MKNPWHNVEDRYGNRQILNMMAAVLHLNSRKFGTPPDNAEGMVIQE